MATAWYGCLWLYGYMVVWLCGHGIWRYAYMAILLWPYMVVYGYASMASVWVNLAVCNSMALRLDLKTYTEQHPDVVVEMLLLLYHHYAAVSAC